MAGAWPAGQRTGQRARQGRGAAQELSGTLAIPEGLKPHGDESALGPSSGPGPQAGGQATLILSGKSQSTAQGHRDLGHGDRAVGEGSGGAHRSFNSSALGTYCIPRNTAVSKTDPNNQCTSILAFLLLRISSKEMKTRTRTHTCTRMFVAAPFIIAKRWGQSKYPLTDEQIAMCTHNGILPGRKKGMKY